ncbi:hypothetical protein BDN70DRAFT_899908 [Pholiota conissans]|uniref:Uncharacterized protein n=1 Tax=Pholiota conissans TaxID=109636 RepID=A0A9P6CV60_9AGAR|nr:hypothetical protein BDN70DRAFT_899908 [Pholiota conissans]
MSSQEYSTTSSKVGDIQPIKTIDRVKSYSPLPHPFAFGGPRPARPNPNSMETFQLKKLPPISEYSYITSWAITKVGDASGEFHFTLCMEPSLTTIFKGLNEVGRIYWDFLEHKPFVFAKGVFSPPMPVNSFFQLSEDETYRDMYYACRPYSWCPVEIEGSKMRSVFLYSRGGSQEGFHAKAEQARVYCNPVDGGLLFDITHEARAAGLMLPCIIYCAQVYKKDGPSLKLQCSEISFPQ